MAVIKATNNNLTLYRNESSDQMFIIEESGYYQTQLYNFPDNLHTLVIYGKTVTGCFSHTCQELLKGASLFTCKLEIHQL